MQNFSYHTHTIFSDGIHSVEQMLLKAKSLGLEEYGISDHLIVHKNVDKVIGYDAKTKTLNTIKIYKNFTEAKPNILKQIAEIKQKAQEIGIKVKVGFEVDYFTYDGWGEDFKQFIKDVPCDYLISGNHFFFDKECENIIDIFTYQRMAPNQEQRQEYIKNHYNAMIKAVESGLFTFLAHLDYVRTTIGFEDKELRLKVVDALAKNNLPLEINTKGYKKWGDYYPAKWLLGEIIKKDIPLILSDDCHDLNDIAYHFKEAEKLLSTYPNVTRFRV